MPRSASVSQPHPSSRYRDKIRLRQGRRGPSDLLWCATFFLDGRWQTGKPVSRKREPMTAYRFGRLQGTLLRLGESGQVSMIG